MIKQPDTTENTNEEYTWQRDRLKELLMFFPSLMSAMIGMNHSTSSPTLQTSEGAGRLWPYYAKKVSKKK
jgi:hypothetical protein